jgi:hypothetical protein
MTKVHHWLAENRDKSILRLIKKGNINNGNNEKGRDYWG